MGSIITTVSANDVDSYPALNYRIEMTPVAEVSDPYMHALFAIDRYSGKVILKRRLDYENCQEYHLEIVASDGAHEARTTFTVRVADENDNAPVFSAIEPPSYFALLPGIQYSSSVLNNDHIELISVNATDSDNSESPNSKIHYTINPPVRGFSINEELGTMYVNLSQFYNGLFHIPHRDDLYVIIWATDAGLPPLQTSTVVRVKVHDHGFSNVQFRQTHYHAHINENAPLGTIVLQLNREILDTDIALEMINNSDELLYLIANGNEDGMFEIFENNALMLVRTLDREICDLYKLRLIVSEEGASIEQLQMRTAENSTAAINIFVTVEDANDNVPIFTNSIPSASNVNGIFVAQVSELSPLRHTIAQLEALDADADNTPYSEVVYEITSGNDESMFTIDLLSGVLFVNNQLDYDTGAVCYEVIIRACDSASPPLCSLQPFRLSLEDENDNTPRFPIMEYIESVAENEPLGTSIFRAQATDLDRGVYGHLNYTIEREATIGSDNISWKLFRVDPYSGVVTTNAVFDYEQRHRYDFLLQSTDVGGKQAQVRVRIQIESRDEHAPQFTERTYRFVMPAPSIGYLPLGYVVGQVAATDQDKGPDGRVVYQLNSQHAYFKINRTNGAVLLKKKLDDHFDLGRDVSLVVSASSGRQGSLSNMTVVEISLDPLVDSNTNYDSNGGVGYNGGNVTDWVVAIITLILLVLCACAGIFLFVRMRRSKPARNVAKPHLSVENVGNSNSYVDPSAFDTIPIRNAALSSINTPLNTTGQSSAAAAVAAAMAAGQFPPPKYDEIPPYGTHATSSNSGAATTSELSGSEQSGSSGRGSAEDDGEDEEIRMINEGPLRTANNNDDGRLSDISVQNTQEYLARLGIVNRESNTNGATSNSSIAGSNKDPHLHHTLPMHVFDEDPNTESDITNLIYAKLNDVNATVSDRGSSADEAATTAGSIGTTVDHVMGFGNIPAVVGSGNVGPSMTGSLSSIVHSEEELTGSYNWDYLLDWGPQYQPLAHVFSEIARLKDDNISVQSGHSGASSSNKSKQSIAHCVVKPHIPPPLLTNVAPRAINLPVLGGSGVNMRLANMNSHQLTGNNSNTNTVSNHMSSTASSQYMMPRSPINHDTPDNFSTSAAMSPSFSPSLSPLATRSPSISPLGGVSSTHHRGNVNRHEPQANQRSKSLTNEQVRM